MVRDGDVENTVDQQRCAFDHRLERTALGADSGNFVYPLLGNLVHICGRDLGQRAVALAAVVAIESGPVVDGRFSDSFRVERNVGCGQRRPHQRRGHNGCAQRSGKSHLSVSK